MHVNIIMEQDKSKKRKQFFNKQKTPYHLSSVSL